MKIDIETIFLVLIIVFIIHNYYNKNCYQLINYDLNAVFEVDNDKYYKNRERFTGFPKEPKLEKTESSFTKMPDIILEGLENNTGMLMEGKFGMNMDNNSLSIPHKELLNDRYNPLSATYKDSQLQGIIISDPIVNDGFDYNESMSNHIKDSGILDMDSKLYLKSQRNQKLFKDSKTIASNFGKKSLMESYKNELDFYEKKQAWWEENVD